MKGARHERRRGTAPGTSRWRGRGASTIRRPSLGERSRPALDRVTAPAGAASEGQPTSNTLPEYRGTGVLNSLIRRNFPGPPPDRPALRESRDAAAGSGGAPSYPGAGRVPAGPGDGRDAYLSKMIASCLLTYRHEIGEKALLFKPRHDQDGRGRSRPGPRPSARRGPAGTGSAPDHSGAGPEAIEGPHADDDPGRSEAEVDSRGGAPGPGTPRPRRTDPLSLRSPRTPRAVRGTEKPRPARFPQPRPWGRVETSPARTPEEPISV
jgi:hypothetical protein